MIPTALWDIYYHAMKEWLPTATDKQVRESVEVLMDMSVRFVILFQGNLNDEITKCPHCKCMTKTVEGKCGKCEEKLDEK